ncbi:MAG: hypothetical protein WD871_01050 [Xanthobacteraceae bacterium]
MRAIVALILVLAAVGGTTDTASAQSANVTARIGAGQTARITAAPVPGEGVLLEIALPGGRSQSFPQLGTELVAIDGKPDGSGLLARDLNGDGVDEIVIRGLVPPERGALLVFRWDRSAGEFVPVEFTDDRDQTTKFLVVDGRLPVLIDGAGTIEAQYETTRPDGRKSTHVARYRWTDKGFSQSADN